MVVAVLWLLVESNPSDGRGGEGGGLWRTAQVGSNRKPLASDMYRNLFRQQCSLNVESSSYKS